MQLPFFKKSSPVPTREYFYALEIDHFSVKSAIWSVINAKTQVLAVGSPSSWDDKSPESLITACDHCLSDTATRLDPAGKIQPEKVILGLPPDWIEQDKIIPVHQHLLKSLTQKLSLKAVGYVVTPEAVVKYIHVSEGAPPTAILLGIWPHHVEVTLVRLGKIIGVHEVARSSQVTDDVFEGLSRFPHSDMLPSRMLLYDSGLDLEAIKQRLLSHPWQAPQSHLSFLHFPKIESLPGDFTIRAIALAGGTEVARAIGLLADEPLPSAAHSGLQSEPEPSSTPQELGFTQEEPQEVEQFIPAPQPQASPPVTRPKFKLPQLPPLPHINLTFAPLVIILGLVLVFGGLFAVYWYLPKATVSVTVDSKTASDQFDVTVDTQASLSDLDKPLLPAKMTEVSTDDSKSAPATGTKLVGDKATGSVTIVNGTSTPKSFPAGTVLTSPTNLKFTLDSAADVASASGTADPNSYQPGKTTTKITASQIGTDSNLSAGTQFRIGTFAVLDVVAKNDAALSGGSSRQVKAVSKDDISKLRTELSASLKDKVLSLLQSKIPSTDFFIPATVQTQTASEEFDHKDGDAADNLTLKLTVKAQAVSLSKSDMDSLIQKRLASQVPQDYAFSGSIDQNITVKKAGSPQTILSVSASTPLTPELSSSQITQAILGKSEKFALNYLSSLPGVSNVQISFSFRLPGPLQTLPHTLSHIKLDIEAK